MGSLAFAPPKRDKLRALGELASGVERFNAFAHSVLPEQISDTKQVQIENY